MKKLIIVLLTAGGLASCTDKVETYTVEKRVLNEAVYASGEILPAEYDLLKVSTSERILRILVKEGDTVMPGNVLAILGTTSEDRQLDILSNQVALARENTRESEAILSELRSKIKQAEVKYQQDSLNAARYRELVKSKAVSEKDAEQAIAQFEVSRTEYESLEQKYRAQKNELQSKLLSAEQELARLNQSREGKVLTSSLEGKVYSINIEEGELAKPEEPILMVGSAGNFKLELLVDERDISRIQLGQKVYFETDAYAGEQFEAEIIKIVPVLQKENRSFKVEARVLDEKSFYPQSSVEANIVIRENVETLVIPTGYLLKGDSVILNDEEEQKKKITTGARDGNWIEVREGLAEGDVIQKSK